MLLSTHFDLAEMTRSAMATQERIPNDPSPAEIENLRILCAAILDPLRDSLGKPVKVNSGYRCPALNLRLGGAPSSQHIQGKATDIQCPGITVLRLFKTIVELELPFDQLIYEAASSTAQWVHVSHDSAFNRAELRVARFGPNGRPQSYPVISRLDALAMAEVRARAGGPLEYFEMGDEPH